MEHSVLFKGLKRPDTKNSKIAGLSRMFFFATFTWATIGHGWADVLRPGGGGHSITKHMGGWLDSKTPKYLSKTSNI